MFQPAIRSRLPLFCLSAAFGLSLATPAQAFFDDIVKTKTESKSMTATYDLPGASNVKQVQDIVHKALTYHGDNAHVREGMALNEPPATPKRISFKEFSFGPVSMQIPQCDEAVFSVSSSDGSMAKWGDSANYMACGFRYQGGMRVAFFAQSKSTSGGVSGLLSGKTIGTMITKAIGMNSDPMAFIETSLSKMEEQFNEAKLSYSLVEMAPLMGKREVVADPLVAQQRSTEKKAADRAKRMAARSELSKLGVEASDHERFLKAVRSGDEDMVALFLEAGVVDHQAVDAEGRKPVDLAKKPAVKAMLQG
nr:hypothetical protein [uncultured Roseateles sp.]